MKPKNRKLCLSLALSLTMLSGVTAFAEDVPPIVTDEPSNVVFNQNKEVVVSDLFDNFKGVMPGDKLTENITISNECGMYDYVEVYMKAQTNTVENVESIADHTVEQGDVINMDQFLAQLDMTVVDGAEIYHDSPDDESTLTENVFLAKLNRNESVDLDVNLNVPIGMGNEFAYRQGEVDWVFTIQAFNNADGGDGGSSSTNTTSHTVRKVWVDKDSERPESIVVELLKNGKYYDEVILSAENQWVYTWSRLTQGKDWDVVEADVPEGYKVSYSESGGTTTITNTGEIKEEVIEPEVLPLTDLSVQKVWDENSENIPEQVQATLYQGETAVETVWLGAWNDWRYTWNDVVDTGNLQIVETNIPNGYVPSYSYEDGVVTITNTATLIQTGQLNWPIYLLGVLGILFMLLGAWMLLKKRKQKDA